MLVVFLSFQFSLKQLFQFVYCKMAAFLSVFQCKSFIISHGCNSVLFSFMRITVLFQAWYPRENCCVLLLWVVFTDQLLAVNAERKFY